jgi:hypothetical protein
MGIECLWCGVQIEEASRERSQHKEIHTSGRFSVLAKGKQMSSELLSARLQGG